MTTSRTLSRHTDRLDVPPSAGTKTWVAIDPRGNFRNYLATLGKPSRVRRRSATLLILLCLLASSPLQPQHVQGRVLFGSEPVGSATISLFDSSMNVLATSSTSAEGWFLINASSRARSLAVKRLGFRPTYVEVQSSHTDDTLQITIRLERISISLSPVVVRVEVDALKDFRIVGYNARSFPATFVTKSQIQSLQGDPRTYTDIFRQLRITSVYVDETCVRELLGGACLNVWLNDRLMAGGGDEEWLKVLQHLIEPSEVDHIVYVRSQEAVPDELRGSLLIYTQSYAGRLRRAMHR